MRRVGLIVALAGLLSLAVACTAPAKPAVSLTWQNLTDPGVPGTRSGHDLTYAFTAANFPANSRLSLQRLQAGSWITSSIVVAAKSGTGTIRPPSGRDQYRLELTDISGNVLASAQRTVDVYDEFGFSTLFSLPTKNLASDDFDYDFRDFAGRDRSSCWDLDITVDNASNTPEVVRFTYTPLGEQTAVIVNRTIDRANGTIGIISAIQPGTDWAVTAQGADLYMAGVGTCYSSDGRA